MGRASVWRGEAIPPVDTVSIKTSEEGQYRRFDGSSRAKLEEIAQIWLK